MTHEQAINYLTSSGMTPEQVTEVVEALTEPHTETLTSGYVQEIRFEAPCVDCVSRDSVVKKLHEYFDPLEDGEDICPVDIYNDIEALPSVTPAEKVGKWTRELIRNERGGCIGAKMICSECGEDNGYDKRMRFCPNCGAKMEVKDE